MRKIKFNKKIVLFIIILIFSIVLMIYSLINIFNWSKDNKKTDEMIDKIQNMVDIEAIENDQNNDSSTTETDENTEKQENSIYFRYTKISLIDVDFKELKKINSETKGWIQVVGTNINYPFVQSKDNKYYLNHSFDKTYTDAGWVFLDYRNDIDNLGKNTILYAHARKNKTMFGELTNALKTSWFNNKNNHYIKISTENENSLWQVFSVYHIPTTNDYIKTEFNSDNEYLKLLNTLKKRSKYNFKLNLTKDDKIITLSTCYSDTEKMVMHAKLIKTQKK